MFMMTEGFPTTVTLQCDAETTLNDHPRSVRDRVVLLVREKTI